MATWEELDRKELELEEGDESISREKQQVQQVKEAYEEHFQEVYRFIEEAQHLFHKNENHSFYEAAMAEFSKESYKIRENLDERQQEVEKEKRGIQRKLEDIYDEKRRLSMEEQEKSDEY